MKKVQETNKKEQESTKKVQDPTKKVQAPTKKIQDTTKTEQKIPDKESKKDFDFELLFCSFCLRYPEYTIYINKNGNISLCHLCNENKTMNIQLSEIHSFHSKIYSKKCEYCQRSSFNLCLKCGKFICESCKDQHESSKGILNDEYREATVVSINNSQYFCNQHFRKVTHFCNFCKLDLCQDYCLIEHQHCKNESLIIKNEIKPSCYKGSNKTLITLANLSNAFYQCYAKGLEDSKLTIKIVLNLYLIEPINSFIKEKKDKEKMENTTIKNNFKKAKGENYYVLDSFGSESFNEFYFKLIFSSQAGNIKSFHQLMNIKKYYENLNKYKKKILSFEQNYAIFLISSIRQELDKFSLNSNFKYFREFPLLLLETKQQLNQLQILHNKLELDFEFLKKFVISIDYRVDFEFRRKIGNIIADKIVDAYGDNIDKIELTEYLLGLSIEDIEKKIIKVNTKNISDKDKNISLEELKIIKIFI